LLSGHNQNIDIAPVATMWAKLLWLILLFIPHLFQFRLLVIVNVHLYFTQPVYNVCWVDCCVCTVFGFLLARVIHYRNCH